MDNTNALVPTNQDQIALYEQSLAGMGEYIPKIEPVRLVQPIEIPDLPAGTIAGRFLASKSNEQFETMRIVPLEFRVGRVLFPPDSDRGTDPLCRSNDGLVPVTTDDRVVPQDGGKGCKGCQHSQWKKIGGKSIKPACIESLSLLFLDQETMFPYRLNAKSSNIVPMKDFKDSLMKKVMMSKMKGRLVPHFGFTTTISATKVAGKKGTYYVLTFSPPTEVKDPASFGPLYERLVLRKGVVQGDGVEVESAINSAVDGEYVVEG